MSSKRSSCGTSWDLWGHPRDFYGHFWAIQFGPFTRFDPFRGHFRPFWAILDPFWAILDPFRPILGTFLAFSDSFEAPKSHPKWPKWSKMGPKWPKWVQNGSKTGPQRGPKGGPKGGPKWVPQRSKPKKSRKIFFLWPQSTKKVTHVPVFEEKKLFLRKKN